MLKLLRECWDLTTEGSRSASASLAVDLLLLGVLDLAQLVCLRRILDGIDGPIALPVAGLVATAVGSG